MFLRRVYGTPGRKEAFSGITNLMRYTGQTNRNVREALEESETYTRFREPKSPRVYNPYFVWEPRKLFQIDLVDFSSDGALVRRNGGNKYILCVIDSFSRFAWVKPLKNKTWRDALEAYRVLSTKFRRQPQRVLCDKGGEFSRGFARGLLDLGSTLIVQKKKAGTVERFQRSLQSLIYKHVAESGDRRFIDDLDELMRSYNTRHHRAIQMSPSEAERAVNRAAVRDNLREYYAKAKRKKPRYKVGDKVRLPITQRSNFPRGYKQRFTDQVYEIVRINTVLPRPLYSVAPLDNLNNPLNHTYYAEQLQRVKGKMIFKDVRVLNSETGEDGEVRHRVEASISGKKQIAWFDDEELQQLL